MKRKKDVIKKAVLASVLAMSLKMWCGLLKVSISHFRQ